VGPWVELTGEKGHQPLVSLGLAHVPLLSLGVLLLIAVLGGGGVGSWGRLTLGGRVQQPCMYVYVCVYVYVCM